MRNKFYVVKKVQIKEHQKHGCQLISPDILLVKYHLIFY